MLIHQIEAALERTRLYLVLAQRSHHAPRDEPARAAGTSTAAGADEKTALSVAGDDKSHSGDAESDPAMLHHAERDGYTCRARKKLEEIEFLKKEVDRLSHKA